MLFGLNISKRLRLLNQSMFWVSIEAQSLNKKAPEFFRSF